MAGLGIQLETPATLVRSSTTELPRPISMVHVAPTTTNKNIDLVNSVEQKKSKLY